MSALETLLSRLEAKMTPGDEGGTPNIEEEKLRKKLSELGGSVSDKSSDEDGGGGVKKPSPAGRGPPKLGGGGGMGLCPEALKDKHLSSSSDEAPTEAQKVYMAAGQSFQLESKLRRLEQGAKTRFGGNTDSELEELEDVVARTAARVQGAESEVSDIETKLAALNAPGSRKKTQAVCFSSLSAPLVMERKLDLSRLTDEEAKHVWEVIQRDFNLRKKEEERLGDLKTKIEKEDTKRELLGAQSPVADSLCIRCLQPFKFLVNSKRQCLDCRMYTCKSCSRYNKKEHGWVCDNCRMTRVLKIGTVGWYHDNVRNRFKRFGSAKVMRSLYKRLNGDGGRDDDTQSMPDVRSHVYNNMEDDHGEAEAQRYKVMRKNKRLLSVHPMDFDSEEYFPYSRRPSMQQMQEDRFFRNDLDYENYRANRRKSLDRYAMRPEELLDSRMVRTRSLSKISSSVARQQYVDTSDEEEEDYHRYAPVYQQPLHRRRSSRTSSQENLGQQPPPINELNKRMSALETLLSRLEAKMTPGDEGGTPNIEEEKLRKKLSELGGSVSDKSSDEDGGGGVKKPSPAGRGPPKLGGGGGMGLCPEALKDKHLSSSSDEAPTEAQKRSTAAALCDLTTEVLRTINATEGAMVEYGLAEPAERATLAGADVKQADDAFRELEENVYMAAGQSFQLESKLRRLEQGAKTRFGGNTDSELEELEDVVARTAARVQGAESEVSDIETKLAALNAPGSRKKASGSHQRKKSTQDVSKSNGAQWKTSNMF